MSWLRVFWELLGMKGIAERTEFWIILAVIITFIGCIRLAQASIDLETLFDIQARTRILQDQLQRIEQRYDIIIVPEDREGVPTSIPPAETLPQFMVPTVTPE